MAKTGSGVAHIASPLFGKMHLGVDAVAVHVAQALARGRRRPLAQPILALQLVGRSRSGRWPSDTRHFTPLLVGDDARQALAVLLVDARRPRGRPAR